MRWTFEISEVRPGMGFFALKGEKFDGHALISAALAAGAADVIDGQEELRRRARDYRRTLKATVIGVTGSSGKITTKEFLKVFLAKAGKTHATDGNYNNIIGLPLTILECPPDADFLVLEMGTSSPGEIAALCDIAEPDVGVLTNIGTAHLERLKTPEGIAEEKVTALGMTAAYFQNASGLSLKSRISAADLLKLGEAAVANPTLARIWAATERTVELGGPHARQEKVEHVYAKLEGYEAFVRRYPFLGGKGGSICCDQLSVRAHLIVTEVAGERILIALAGQEAADDPFALDLEVCGLAEAMLAGMEPPSAPGLAALEKKLGGYAFASLDGRLRYESREAHRPQVPASATKILTALCALDVVKDISRKLTLRSQDILGGSGYACFAGDEISFEDALYSMMLPSSNTMAESVATAAGALMLAEKREGGEGD